jgi:hypothetical protein
MIDLTNVLTLNENQICRLLENHQLFDKAAVKLAAKIKVKNDKRSYFHNRAESQRMDDYNSLQHHRNAYNVYQGRVTDSYGLGLGLGF